ncbi:hypothetical protein ACFOY8_14225 [Thalassospira xianhensis]|uniref:Uncharacterized protein n=1 Tax=Thalassospira xianhensis MCCC 1A02616 TaxID=1177929 RepID=A0A367UHJ9_9PROT|nr:hypothetical protein [Thalassospira xianhensis]RCK07688.1 hypothetical protein TH5_01040 [Thalassospira xianhensis MCCC 1A02616]
MVISSSNVAIDAATADELAQKADALVKRMDELGVKGITSSEVFMMKASELVTRDPSLANELGKMAYELNLDAAPVIAEKLKEIAAV